MFSETQQQNPAQWGAANQQIGQGQSNQNPLAQALGQQGSGQQGSGQQGIGQAAFGQPQQSYGWGGQQQTRQLSQQDVGDVVRQLVPLLPQILAQAQQQPQAAFGGQSGWGQGGNSQQRQLSQQDISEVVRQILPIVPQIVSLLQGQSHIQAAYGQTHQQNPFQQQQNPYQQQNPFQQQMQNPFQQQGGQQQGGQPQLLAAFGSQSQHQQRQLSPQDVNEVVRQLVTVIPQVIGSLQSVGQQNN